MTPINTGAVVPADETQDHADELEAAGEHESGEDTGQQATANEGETEEGRKKRLSGAQRNKIRIERLENEVAKWRDTALGFATTRVTPEPEDKKAAPAEDKRPRKEDFIVDKEAGTYDAEKYEDALLDWNSKQTEKRVLGKIDARDQAKSQQSEQSRMEQTWRQREAPVEAKYDDYKELSTVAVTFLQRHSQSPTAQAIGASITESELGPELLRHLGEEFETLERISKLSPTAAVRELGKIEARLAPDESAASDEADNEELPIVPPVKVQNKPPTPTKKTSAVSRPFNPLDPGTWKDSREYEQKMAAWEKRRLGS